MFSSSFGVFHDPWRHNLSYSEYQRRKQAEAEVARRKAQEEEERSRMAKYYNNMSRPSTSRQRYSKKVSRKNKSNLLFDATAPIIVVSYGGRGGR